jgi:hypothetical protein
MRITDFPELIAPTGNDLLVTVDIANDLTKKVKLDNLPISLPALTALATKQDSLVSGVTIKTVNSQSLLGAGDIPIPIVTPSGVAGAIQFSNGSAFASDASNLFWDDTNKRLGVGTNAPTQALDVVGQGRFSDNILLTTDFRFIGRDINGSSFRFSSASNEIRANISTGGQFHVHNAGSGTSRFAVSNGGQTTISGGGTTSGTTSLLVQNSAGTTALQVQDNLNTILGGILTIPNFQGIFSGSNSISFETGRTIFNATAGTFGGQYAYNFTDGGGATGGTSGTLGRFNLASRFAPTSGTAVYNTALINPTVNQTGGANGITRGLYINPTLTAAADFRAIEVADGNVLIGNSASNTAKLSIKGSGTTGATTAVLVQNSDGVQLFRIDDDRDVFFGSSTSNYIHQGIFFQGDYYGVGNWNFGTTSNLGARLGIKGSGSTSATTSLLVQNSAGTELLKVLDNGTASLGGLSFNGSIVQGNPYFAGIVYGPNYYITGGTANFGASVPANASAQLELTSTTKGFLPPRMTTTQINAIASPATGLEVFNTTLNCTCFYNGTGWRQVTHTAM